MPTANLQLSIFVTFVVKTFHKQADPDSNASFREDPANIQYVYVKQLFIGIRRIKRCEVRNGHPVRCMEKSVHREGMDITNYSDMVEQWDVTASIK